jgi:hypothetical protein
MNQSAAKLTRNSENVHRLWAYHQIGDEALNSARHPTRDDDIVELTYYRVIASVVDGSSSGPNGAAGSMLTSRITRTRWVYDGNTPTLNFGAAA